MGSTSGVLNIDKPKGLTSHDVVNRVRKVAQIRRVGHAGTLDPLATGVLLVCVDKATRIAEYLADGRKEYLATIRFGVTTDTWDADGRALQVIEFPPLAVAEIAAALAAFVGRIDQVPPLYSALKRDGQPLYRLARQGVEVERAPRAVEIYRLELVEWRSPDLEVIVECSKGTYVRSLAHELGQRLGPGAHLASLVRLAVGPFRVEDAVALDALEGQGEEASWRSHLISLKQALGDREGVTVDHEVARCLRFGQAVPLSVGEGAAICCAYDSDDNLVAILERVAGSDLWQPRKVFLAD